MAKSNKITIFRPKEVVVSIFGTDCKLKRLSRGDVIDAFTLLIDEYQKTGGNLIKFLSLSVEEKKEILLSLSEVLDLLLHVSFPDFKEWEELGVDGEIQLFEVIWKENNLQGVIENFSRLTR